MKYHLIASGSKGNCLLVGHLDKWLVIDCGVSQKYFLDCLLKLNITLDQIKAVIISHGHSDHYQELKCLKNVLCYSNGIKDEEINYSDDFMIDDFKVIPLLLSHDYQPTYGFVIEVNTKRLGYITDTGYLREIEINKLKGCDYLIIESNYDEELLLASDRSWYLKKRIMSNKGHLSNQDTKKYLDLIVWDHDCEIVLAHISQDVNSDECLKRVFRDYKFKIARQFEIVSNNS